MSAAGLAPPLQVSLPGETAIMLLVVLVGGLAGMSIRNVLGSLVADEDGEESEDADTEEGLSELGGLDDGDDLGGLGGLDDDGEMGGLGNEGFDDGGAEFDEIEGRIDELENEVGSLSSTVSTVRSENEQIAESVDEVEENVRKLLDIYEMVTRGVNPFADDVDAGMGGGLDGGDGGSFGIFDDDEDEPAEDIDESVVEADAEGFFDDDLVEEDGFDGGGLDDDFESGDTDDTGGEFDEAFAEAGEDGFGEGGFDDDFDGGFDEGGLDDGDAGGGDDDGDAGGDGGSTSFEELKSEYESGEADWADDVESSENGGDETTDEEEPDESKGRSDRADDEDAETHDTDADGETAGGTEELDGLADDELFDEVIEEDPDGDDTEITAAETDTAARSATDGGGQPQALSRSEDAETDAGGDDPDAPAEDGSADQDPNTRQEAPASPGRERDRSTTGAQTSAATDGGKPYLAALPEGLATELIVFEWLEFLVAEGGIRETARALEYYERVDWIDERVRQELDAYLAGFDETGDGTLTIEHHTTSLEYIDQLEGGNTIVTAGLGQGGRDGL